MKSKQQQKKKPKVNWIYLIIAGIISFIPFAVAFGEGIPMMNLWDLFVEQMFGSFWVAVFFIALVYFILLMLANISVYTVIILFYYYFLAMSLGYGNFLISWILIIGGIIIPIFQVLKLSENR